MNYRTQFANNNLASRRHELDAIFNSQYLDLEGLYFFSKALEGTLLDDSREQAQGAARIRFNPNWSFKTSASYDLGADAGLREAGMGLEYTGDCLSVALTSERELTDEVSGDSGTEFFLRIGLKNLGNFETSGISFDSEDE